MRGLLITPALLACLAAPVLAQDDPSPVPQPSEPASELPAADAPCACTTIPALTPVSIEIGALLGSKISKSGDTFPIRLAAPLIVDGRETVPAGTAGMGEVVHAKKGSGSGAPGELVLAARYLDVGDRQLRLRSLRFAAVGRSAAKAADAIALGGAASGLPIGILGFMITGGEAVVQQGTIAEAKTAAAFTIADAPAVETTAEGDQPPAAPVPDGAPPGEEETTGPATAAPATPGPSDPAGGQ
jgi:hypothetical protein